MKRNRLLAVFATSALLVITSSRAGFGCPSGQFESCILDACVCLPATDGDVGEVVDQLAANALAPLIQQSRDDAISGSMPIPRHIRQALTGYVSEDSMNRARYKVGESGIANLGRLAIEVGHVGAITLIDVIVFKGPTEANDPALWAHDLTHVDQYRDLGLKTFAIRYVRNINSIEGPAYAKSDGYLDWAGD